MILKFEDYSYNEGVDISKDKIEKALKIIQKKFPYEKAIKYIKKYKSEIKSAIQKYTNGKDTVYVNKIMTTNEGFKDTMFYDLFIDSFTKNTGSYWDDKDGMDRFMGVFVWVAALFVAGLLYFCGLMLYLNFFYTPIQKGIVEDVSFSPAHTALIPMVISTGKSTTTILVPTYIPDTWQVEVKEMDSEETEVWTTTNKYKGEDLKEGETISWDDASYNVLKGK